jgi:outer membrane receptor protein involved in Fe transport
LAALAAATAAGANVCVPTNAYAQGTGAGAAQQAQLRPFNIEPQPLAEALVKFGQQSGTQVSAHGDLVRGLSSPGVTGSLTAEAALTRLLAGTGISYHRTDANTVTLVKQESDSPAVTMLGPIAVYGARTTQTLNDVTSSVGIVTGETIEERQVRSIRDSFRLMANVRDSDFNDAGFVIRGINSEGLTPGGAPVASFYVDGIQQTVQGARRGARGLWDVEQVEIYRGPQSTLAGRAALAGAIYVKTKDPTDKFEVGGRALVGTDETYGGAAMLNVPVIDDQVALRLAAEYERSESDINYPTYARFNRYDDFIEDEYYSLRAKALIKPAKLRDARALLTYSYSEDSPSQYDIAGPGLGFEFEDRRGDFNTPNFAEDRRTVVHNAGMEITYDIVPALILTSQSGFTHSDTDRSSINVGTPGETDVVIGDFVQKLATQEFRLNQFGSAWETTLGVYGAYEKQDSGFRRPDFFGFASDISKAEEETWNVAAFGEATYEFIPSWKAVAGGRVDHTRQEGSSFFSRNGVAITDFSYELSDTVFLPKVGLIKEFGPDHTVGFTVQRAFRAGGAGVQSSTGEVFQFGPELAWNYELSYKGRFLNNRLNLASNIFYLDLRDQQIETLEDPLDPLSATTTNAAKSRAYGFEIEAQGQATREISAFASIGYVNSKFEEFDSASLGDLSGLWFPEAPRWNVAWGARYMHSLGFFVGADAKYTSRYQARIGQDPQEKLESYVIFNAQVGYRYDRLTVKAFAENLLDEQYYVFNDNDIAATEGRGRFVGVALEAKF